MRVRLTAKTHKGKNRIANHGPLWDVLTTSDYCPHFSPADGPWLALEAPRGYLMWVHATHDQNYGLTPEEAEGA